MIDLGVQRPHVYAARKVVATASVGGKELGPASGTGFLVMHSARLWLVTNRHVVDWSYLSADHLGATPKTIVFSGFDLQPDEVEVESTWCIDQPVVTYAAGFDDVAVVDLTAARLCAGQQGPFQNFYSSALLASAATFSSNDPAESIVAPDVLAICGFPQIGGQQTTRPLALVGFIASDPAHPPEPRPLLASGQPLRGDRTVLYQGFSRGGASGSPVIAVQRGLPLSGSLQGPPTRPARLVGINAGRITGSSAEPSALSYFVRSDAVLDALTDAATK